MKTQIKIVRDDYETRFNLLSNDELLLDKNNEPIEKEIGYENEGVLFFYKKNVLWKELKKEYDVISSYKDFCKIVEDCRYSLFSEIKEENQRRFNSYYGYAMSRGGGRRDVNKMYGSNYSSEPKIKFE